MVFWNQATFVTYGWNGQERKARLLSAVVCDSQHKNYTVANEELIHSIYATPVRKTKLLYFTSKWYFTFRF